MGNQAFRNALIGPTAQRLNVCTSDQDRANYRRLLDILSSAREDLAQALLRCSLDAMHCPLPSTSRQIAF